MRGTKIRAMIPTNAALACDVIVLPLLGPALVEALVSGVIDSFVKLGASSHLVEEAGLRSGRQQFCVRIVERPKRHPERGHWEDHHLVAKLTEPGKRDDRRAAELGHIGQQ